MCIWFKGRIYTTYAWGSCYVPIMAYISILSECVYEISFSSVRRIKTYVLRTCDVSVAYEAYP